VSKDDEEIWDDSPDCFQCDGEGFVYGCSWDWQCDTWDGDSCLCTRRCDVCNPYPPSKDDQPLRQILADDLAHTQEPE
jgi:hypothetical protein